MTTAKPPARYSAPYGARAGGFALTQLHHSQGRDLEDILIGLTFVFFILAGIAQIIQELVFRGYLQTALANRMPAWAAIAAASAAYVAFHAIVLHAAWWPMVFVAGLGIGTVFHLTRSLWPTVLTSVLYDLLTLSF